MNHKWDVIIGLEIHAQLNTKSKLFSGDANRFGDEPNVNISALTVGLPGSLPVLNKEAVRKAIRFGLATQGQVQLWSRFDRKSYFYPDCPRNYQITQYEFPIVRGGHVVALVDGNEKAFSIHCVQLEDDAGMLKHFSSFAGVDFNRAGVPLIEIVSKPCMSSAKEAVAYAMAVRSILEYLDVSDCNMEEGSLRFDVNVSVRPQGETAFRNKIEIKNMNSFSNLEQAVAHEIERQIALYEQNPNEDPGQIVPQATFRWDPQLGKTVLMRTKENAEDYRYFPEPDLLPLVLQQEEIDAEQERLPELPLEKERRFVREFGLSAQQSCFFTMDRRTADYFEQVVEHCSYPKLVANWLAVEFTGRLKDQGKMIWNSGILPVHIAELIGMIQEKRITGKMAKTIADDMVANPGLSPRKIVEQTAAYRPFQDLEQLQVIVQEVVREHPEVVQEVLAGRDRKFAYLVGQVMKRTQGSALPDDVNRLLRTAIECAQY